MKAQSQECRYVDEPRSIPTTQGLCAEINGCGDRECPMHHAFRPEGRRAAQGDAMEKLVASSLLGL